MHTWISRANHTCTQKHTHAHAHAHKNTHIHTETQKHTHISHIDFQLTYSELSAHGLNTYTPTGQAQMHKSPGLSQFSNHTHAHTHARTHARTHTHTHTHTHTLKYTHTRLS